ncbi:diguanylate cyclase [Erwinia tracheiphila]|uniref:GGDEF domain-containing protein n=1 Tax=Erwinia tracheiphila TaxID=65700 RepID=UPI000341228E|nr:GGDEF domain-containing protein [Erwinia tracheiphila]EOS94918.1 diguanylate cyclase [Erwinia tracheiphila PSU-1]UIA87380.1 diguanylate cyclase [Erwinia tracheiphila]UIA95745.1 diguanylate cyclase [Erwinia tracheiphila]
MINFLNAKTVASQALLLAALRTTIVVMVVGSISYYFDYSTILKSSQAQLLVSTQQKIFRESLPFQEIIQTENNFLEEFKRLYSQENKAINYDSYFNEIFTRHEDGSWTQNSKMYDGYILQNGQYVYGTSATYSPQIAPDTDTRKRFVLSYLLSYKYGGVLKNRFLNFYGVVPEKGFTIFQKEDIAKAFHYSGPDALDLSTYEFYSRGFSQKDDSPIFTSIYYDFSNKAWMTTIAIPDVAPPGGKHKIMACVDLLLNNLMKRASEPEIKGTRSTVFEATPQGKLISDDNYQKEIFSSQGNVSISSLKIAGYYPLIDAVLNDRSGQVKLLNLESEIVAVGRIPWTPWAIAIHYPKSLLYKETLFNIKVIVYLSIATLVLELIILSSVLRNKITIPLNKLIALSATVIPSKNGDATSQELNSKDEIVRLQYAYIDMMERVRKSQESLEDKINERTKALEQANQELFIISHTDPLTKIGNRRFFFNQGEDLLLKPDEIKSKILLAIIDFDYFKKYNDFYGHPQGDQCLMIVANILSENIDTHTDILARIGGEEFALIKTVPDDEEAQICIRKLCDSVSSSAIPHTASEKGIVTISIGYVTEEYNKKITMDALMSKADRALYIAKNSGRNTIVHFGDIRDEA